MQYKLQINSSPVSFEHHNMDYKEPKSRPMNFVLNIFCHKTMQI